MKSQCVIDGCGKPVNARGWCPMHYRRWKFHGDPMVTKDGAGLRLIAESVPTRDRSSCWLDWPFAHQNGYATVGVGWKVAHVVLESDGHSRPPGAYSLHSCDRPGCWNPDHLRWGTHQDNMADVVRRKRNSGPRLWLRGEVNPSAKLTTADVLSIRARYVAGRNQWTGPGNGAELAAEFGVSSDTIRKVARGTKRTHG